jgi:hypothetical protein
MLFTIEDFIRRTRQDLNGLTRRLQEQTARFGHEEARAWERSLPALATALESDRLGSLHVAVRSKEESGLNIEYRLPASNSWADVVLLGRNRDDRPVPHPVSETS